MVRYSRNINSLIKDSGVSVIRNNYHKVLLKSVNQYISERLSDRILKFN